jgi:hypothetical protein
VEAAKQAGVFAKGDELRAARRAEAAERERADAQHRADALREREVAGARFRQNITVGDNSHCGMVTEIKSPIVKVQTMVGEKWFRLEQLYPAGGAPCRFQNGEYQGP